MKTDCVDHHRKRLGSFVLVSLLAVHLLFLCSYVEKASAAHRMRDPFIASPLGPFSLIDNPVSVLYEKEMATKFAFQFTRGNEHISSLASYMEPDQGLGAGALFYKRSSLSDNTSRQAIGYTVAKSGRSGFDYGVTLKRVGRDGQGTWAVDLGFITHLSERLSIGGAAHNVFGGSELNPFNITGALSYAFVDDVAVMASLSSPSEMKRSNFRVGIGFDFHFNDRTAMRIGRIVHIGSEREHWLGSFSLHMAALALEVTVSVEHSGRESVALGLRYQF